MKIKHTKKNCLKNVTVYFEQWNNFKGWKCYKFDLKNYKSTDTRSSYNPKHKSMKKTTLRYIIMYILIQLLRSNSKKIILQHPKRKDIPITGE